MLDPSNRQASSAIPGKRYFNIGEVSKLCDVRTYVLRYWEQEFPQLRPIKRRGNRRYYQRREVEMIRLIKHYLYEEGFTISGARKQLEQNDGSAKTPASLSRFNVQDLEEIEQQIHELINFVEGE